MAKANILIAEDDLVLRSLYEKKFSMNGYPIRVAADGEEAIKAIEAEKPDLLLLDIHMPKIDGFQILQKYPRATRGFPIILLTNFGEPEYKLRGIELGADDYFVKKDMTIRSLLEMVGRLLSKKST